MKITSALSAVAIAAMLVVTIDYTSMAATGNSFILGQANSANRPTALKNTGTGPVLRLTTTHPGVRPPLGVNSKVKVANFNADLVDGKSASDLGVRTRVYRTPVNGTGVTELNVTVPNVAAGRYLVSYGAWLYSNANTSSWCWLDRGIGGTTSGNSLNPVDPNGYQPINGVGFLNLTSTGIVRLHCEYSGTVTYSNFSGAPMEITLTKVDALSGDVPPAPVRQGARSATR